MITATACTLPARYHPRFLVYVAFGWNERAPTPAQLATVQLDAEVIGGRLCAWVRAPSRDRATEYVAGLLYRAGCPVPPTAITVPVRVDNDSSETPNVVEG